MKPTLVAAGVMVLALSELVRAADATKPK